VRGTDWFKSRWGRQFTLADRAKAYKLTFRNPAGLIALADLMEYCGVADEAPSRGGEFVQGRAAGRRDVGLRIQEHLQLSHEELYDLIRGRNILKPEDFNQ
jgi:hypothetical protein